MHATLYDRLMAAADVMIATIQRQNLLIARSELLLRDAEERLTRGRRPRA